MYEHVTIIIIIIIATCSPAHMSAMVNSSLRLCTKFSEKLKSSNEKVVNLLGTAFSCALCAIQNAHILCKSDTAKSERGQALDKLGKILKDWITDENVIGGSIFGHVVTSYWFRSEKSINWKGKEELKVKDQIVQYQEFRYDIHDLYIKF